ncbi:MAG: 2-dehydro-3-deoxygalactonokinase [Bacteroidota bacterium]
MPLNKGLFWSVDWGTSRLRMRLVEQHSGNILELIESEEGIWRVFQDWQMAGEPERISFFRSRLESLKRAASQNARLDLPILVSGMASSSIGMLELPYAQAPFALDGSGVLSRWMDERCLLISGLQTGEDVMRGEESQCLGLKLRSKEDGCLILPGTHSKHIRIADGKIVDSQTHLTGELYALIGEHSVLSKSLAQSRNQRFLPEAFGEGVRRSREQGILANLFTIRAGELLGKRSIEENADYLSGLLIGAECLSFGVENILLVASPSLQSRYQLAIELLHPNAKLTCLDASAADRLVVDGHRKIMDGQMTPGLS